MNLQKAINPARVLYQDLLELWRRERNFKKARPRSALLFLTFRCTSRCRSCSMWKREIPDLEELDFQGWKRAADELFLNGVRVVELFGGDVFLRKDILLPFLKYLKQLGITVHMPTNAILMDEKTAYSLVESGIDYIYISIDEVGKEHDKIRGVKGNFQSIINGIETLKKARGTSKTPSLICNTTISNMNASSLKQIVAFAHDVGFDTFALEYVGEIATAHIKNSRVNGVLPDPYFIKGENSLLINQEQARELKKVIRHLVKSYSESKLALYTPNVDTLSYKDLYEGNVPTMKCYQERNEVTVDPYGNVIVCPFFSKYILGNLCKEPLDAIWNNQKHLAFRSKQNTGNLEICRHCIMAVERSYGFRKGLERIFYKRIREKLVKSLLS